MSPRLYRNTLAALLLVLLAGLLFSFAGATGDTSNLDEVVNVVSDANTKAKEIAVGLVVLFGSLLAIAIVAMLYRRTSGAT